MGQLLSDEQIARYHADGYLVLEGFAGPAACAALRRRAVEIVDDFQPTGRRTVFTTNEQERITDGEFLDSANNIWAFFEEEAFGEDGQLRQDKSLSINKIGHAMHDLDNEFAAFS